MGMGVAGMIMNSDNGSFPHSLLSTSKLWDTEVLKLWENTKTTYAQRRMYIYICALVFAKL